MRELEARRKRAEEGVRRFEAARLRSTEENNRVREREGLEAILDPHGNLAWLRSKVETTKEMVAAVEMIREGMPKSTRQVCVCGG